MLPIPPFAELVKPSFAEFLYEVKLGLRGGAGLLQDHCVGARAGDRAKSSRRTYPAI